MATKSKLIQKIERGDRYGPSQQDNARRVRLIFRSLLAKHGAGQSRAMAEAHCLRVAELTVAAENLRINLLATKEPTPALVNSVTRAESTAARAERALAKIAPAEDDPRAELARYLANKQTQREFDDHHH